MRNLSQFLAEYRKSHRNPLNQIIHVICVPIIFFSSLGLLWAIPVGQWLGMVGQHALWFNGATLFALPALVFYAVMSPGSLLAMTVWFAVSVWGILALDSSALSLPWVCAGLWVAAWIGQFYGHKVEGAKPSFADDLVFLLIGPLFVMEKLYRRQSEEAAH